MAYLLSAETTSTRFAIDSWHFLTFVTIQMQYTPMMMAQVYGKQLTAAHWLKDVCGADVLVREEASPCSRTHTVALCCLCCPFLRS